MVRLFVAVWPSPEVVAVLTALERRSVPGVRWSTPEQWKITVRPLGHVDDRVVPPLIDVLQAELKGAPVAQCVLGPATRRLGGQWLGAPVSGLEDLAAVVFDVTSSVGVPGCRSFVSKVRRIRGPRRDSTRCLSRPRGTVSGHTSGAFRVSTSMIITTCQG